MDRNSYYYHKYRAAKNKYRQIAGAKIDTLLDTIGHDQTLGLLECQDILKMITSCKSLNRRAEEFSRVLKKSILSKIKNLETELKEILDDNSWAIGMRGQQAEHGSLLYDKSGSYLIIIEELEEELMTPKTVTLSFLKESCKKVNEIEGWVNNPIVEDWDSGEDSDDGNSYGYGSESEEEGD